MASREITVVDLTIREGMQYRGLMFSPDERMKILEFQESLGVDISQVGYPPAHPSEMASVETLYAEAEKRGFRIRVTGLCRALSGDVEPMIESGLLDFHLHTVLTAEMLQRRSVDSIFESLGRTIEHIRSRVKKACIEVSLIDIGRTDPGLLEACARFLIHRVEVDMLTLPDTSGILTPNRLFDKVASIVRLVEEKSTRIGVHCHNDLGMASANTVMGVVAGASVVQVAALGIGERNGIGDLFIAGKCLKEQGYDLNLKIEDTRAFRRYYEYVAGLCQKKTNIDLLNYNTPFFGSSMRTHVAGTHGIAKYGTDSDEEFYLNVLCGKSLVKKYLQRNGIAYDPTRIEEIVSGIKNQSVERNRPVSREEVIAIIGKTLQSL
ncbi:MAG: hypothetical protein GY866_39410 [Proteobacteria bacterium]|nr:hypothetical protein [Pseudomonadota bacterium]